MSDVVLSVEGLTKRYGQAVAVSGLGFEVREGEIFGLLGPNGAGKTTTIRLACGEFAADSGRVLLRGRPMSPSAAERTRVGVCPQEIVVWKTLTCWEQLEFVALMYGMSRRRARQAAGELLAALDLEEKARTRADALSGGMQRRLNIALAVVHDPELVVLDEPSAGLDPQNRVRVRDFVRDLARRMSVLLTTHDMDEADRLCDRVAIIDRGQLLACESPETLKRRRSGQIIELRFLAGTAQAAASALGGLDGIDLQQDPGLLTITATDAAQILPRVLDRLAGAATPADEVRLRAPSLEDVFLGLTGRSLRP